MQPYGLMLLTALLSAQAPAPAPPAQGSGSLDGIVVPRKTEIFISLQRALNSKTASPGDKFSATVQVPVTHDDKIIVPVGSFIIGHVVYKKDPGRIKGKAELQLAFDTVILPDGTTRMLEASVTSAEGVALQEESEDGTLEKDSEKGDKTADAAMKGGVVGAITGASIGVFRSGGSVARGIGVGSAIGAAGGAALALLQRGEDVELPRGAGLTIQLQDDVIFVKPEAAVAEQGRTLKP